VLDQGSGVLLKEETLTREPVAGPHHDALAASMSRALGTLSRDIGQGVTSVCGKAQRETPEAQYIEDRDPDGSPAPRSDFKGAGPPP
jgi:hypothetical protein